MRHNCQFEGDTFWDAQPVADERWGNVFIIIVIILVVWEMLSTLQIKTDTILIRAVDEKWKIKTYSLQVNLNKKLLKYGKTMWCKNSNSVHLKSFEEMWNTKYQPLKRSTEKMSYVQSFQSLVSLKSDKRRCKISDEILKDQKMSWILTGL